MLQIQKYWYLVKTRYPVLWFARFHVDLHYTHFTFLVVLSILRPCSRHMLGSFPYPLPHFGSVQRRQEEAVILEEEFTSLNHKTAAVDQETCFDD